VPIPGSFSLGADGKAGLLEPPMLIEGGLHQQIAEIKNSMLGRIIGKGGSTLALIKTKSGATLQMVKAPYVSVDGTSVEPDPNASSKIIVIGSPDSVSLATQMIQEVLVNGTGKITSMPDRPQTGHAAIQQVSL
jgi:hypothetical protein